jgi:Phage portal protein, lambda family
MNIVAKFYNDFRSKRTARNEQRALALLGTTSPHSVQNGPEPQRRQIQRACLTLQRNYAHLVRNWYESGNPYSDRSRSAVGNYSVDARYDQNPVARRTMEIRCRYWEQNSDLMKSALDVSSQYVIGTHMPVVTSLATGTDPDSNWRDNAEAVFNEMCESAGLNGESMFALLDVGHRRKKVDGNILAIETNKPGKVTIRRGTKHQTELDVLKPCYQLIESQRIATPGDMWINNDSNIVDGVQYAEVETKLASGLTRTQMVKTGYWVNDAPYTMGTQQAFIFVPVEKSYYATTAHRVNEPRGVSDFYCSEPTLALLEDLLKLEMRAQEVQSDLTLFITNGAGQIVDQKMGNTLGAMGIKVSTGQDGKPVVTAKDIENVKAVYEKIWGGRTAVGRTNDTLQFLAPNRPAEATLNLWNFLIDSFCVGSNVPRILVFPKTNKGQGTEVRAEIEKANAAWRKEFNLVWKPFIHRAWKYFMGWAIKNDERVKNPPADWENIEVSPPRSVVVDLGYVSANALAEMAAGVYSLHNWAQDHGTTKQKIIQHSVSDLFDIKLACARMAEQPQYAKYKLTVDPAEVRNNLSDVVKNMAAKATAEAQLAIAENGEPQEAIAA